MLSGIAEWKVQRFKWPLIMVELTQKLSIVASPRKDIVACCAPSLGHKERSRSVTIVMYHYCNWLSFWSLNLSLSSVNIICHLSLTSVTIVIYNNLHDHSKDHTTLTLSVQNNNNNTSYQRWSNVHKSQIQTADIDLWCI